MQRLQNNQSILKQSIVRCEDFLAVTGIGRNFLGRNCIQMWRAEILIPLSNFCERWLQCLHQSWAEKSSQQGQEFLRSLISENTFWRVNIVLGKFQGQDGNEKVWEKISLQCLVGWRDCGAEWRLGPGTLSHSWGISEIVVDFWGHHSNSECAEGPTETLPSTRASTTGTFPVSFPQI